VEGTVRELHVLRVAAAALVAQHHQRPALYFRARLRILQARRGLLTAAFERPGGQQRRRNAGTRRGVRILVAGHVHATGTGFVDQPQDVQALPPVALAYHLVVGYLRLEPAPFADRDGLAHAVEHLRRVVTL